MRELASVLAGLLVAMSAAGCASFSDRKGGTWAPAGGPVGAERVPPPPPVRGTRLGTMGEAYFDFDQAEPKTHDGEQDVLAGVVRTMRDDPSLHVEVAGHTDSAGSEAYNQRLSERRAEAVKRYLVRRGIDASRVDTHGYGETLPVATNSTNAGRAQNRRAEIVAE